MSTTTPSMTTADAAGTPPSRVTRARRGFRHWRGQRPFWAGFWTILAGIPILYFPYANLRMGDLTIRIATTAGAGSLVIGVLLITLGFSMWFQPTTRVFSGIATLVLSLVSIPVSNIGGFLIGFLLGLTGGGMSLAWVPGDRKAELEGRDRGEDTEENGAAAEEDTAADTAGDWRTPGAAAPGTGSALADFGIGGAQGRGPAAEEATTADDTEGKHGAQ
ncbi:DUF6114 domain-containing protein [Streptomyces aidingensis]|uniref:Integral membrane protein n=1 Tax=Streptomyces aidingensis TaxID=910347 RepID=A0A1I1SSV4_9ACTN|nr:DUF6114 domain-containing protein [Streptomyces aidingensis]SFD49534.1 hypothetical protein SAMN05421773_11726 [Streptomyces aidingensis]